MESHAASLAKRATAARAKTTMDSLPRRPVRALWVAWHATAAADHSQSTGRKRVRMTITDGAAAVATFRRPRAVRQPFPPGMAASVHRARVAASDLCGRTERLSSQSGNML